MGDMSAIQNKDSVFPINIVFSSSYKSKEG